MNTLNESRIYTQDYTNNTRTKEKRYKKKEKKNLHFFSTHTMKITESTQRIDNINRAAVFV